MTTTLLCAAAIAAGSLMGARVMTALPAEVIRKIMAIAMLASMGAMVLKLVVSSGTAGTGTGAGALADVHCAAGGFWPWVSQYVWCAYEAARPLLCCC